MAQEMGSFVRFLTMRELTREEVDAAFQGQAHENDIIRVSCSKLLGRALNQNIQWLKDLLPRLIQGVADDSSIRRTESARALCYLEGTHRLILAIAIWGAARIELDQLAREHMKRAVVNLSDRDFDDLSLLMTKAGKLRPEAEPAADDEEIKMALVLLSEGRGQESEAVMSVVPELLSRAVEIFLALRDTDQAAGTST